MNESINQFINQSTNTYIIHLTHYSLSTNLSKKDWNSHYKGEEPNNQDNNPSVPHGTKVHGFQWKQYRHKSENKYQIYYYVS